MNIGVRCFNRVLDWFYVQQDNIRLRRILRSHEDRMLTLAADLRHQESINSTLHVKLERKTRECEELKDAVADFSFERDLRSIRALPETGSQDS